MIVMKNLLLAATILALMAGCDDSFKSSGEDGGTDTDVDTDADTDTDTDTESLCNDPLYGYETECAVPDNPCPCDLFCSQEHLDAEGSTQYFASFYCYPTCDEEQTDESCPGEHDICYYDEIVQRHLCLVDGHLSGDAFEVVLLPDGASPMPNDYSDTNIALTLGEESVLFDRVVGFDATDSYSFVVLNFYGLDTQSTQWLLQMKFPGYDWGVDTFGVRPFGSFPGSEPDPWVIVYTIRMESTTGFNTSSAYLGEISITEVAPAESCGDPDTCPKSQGAAFEVDIVGMMFEQPYN